MIALIDNYDSFSYNLYQLIGSINPNIKVFRNDAITVDELRSLCPEGIILSPGPGKPEEAGICIETVKKLGADIPILGVCLGHQAICTAYGGVVAHAKTLMHGKQSMTDIDTSCPIFKGCAKKIPVARYHSLAATEEDLPDTLKITARAEDGEIMAVMHKDYPVFGVQFHPESIMTPDGNIILRNFLNILKRGKNND